jgi:hypothetical protein
MLENAMILKQDQFLSSGKGVGVTLLGPLQAAKLLQKHPELASYCLQVFVADRISSHYSKGDVQFRVNL